MKTNTPVLMDTKELNREISFWVPGCSLKHLFPNWVLKPWGFSFLTHDRGGRTKSLPPLPAWFPIMLPDKKSIHLNFLKRSDDCLPFPVRALCSLRYTTLAASDSSCCTLACPTKGVRAPAYSVTAQDRRDPGWWTPGPVLWDSLVPQEMLPVNLLITSLTSLRSKYRPKINTS